MSLLTLQINSIKTKRNLYPHHGHALRYLQMTLLTGLSNHLIHLKIFKDLDILVFHSSTVFL